MARVHDVSADAPHLRGPRRCLRSTWTLGGWLSRMPARRGGRAMVQRLVARAFSASANDRRLAPQKRDDGARARSPSRDAGGAVPGVSRASATTRDARRAVPVVSRERGPDRRWPKSRARRGVRARRSAGSLSAVLIWRSSGGIMAPNYARLDLFPSFTRYAFYLSA
jgi:hypothetical protein